MENFFTLVVNRTHSNLMQGQSSKAEILNQVRNLPLGELPPEGKAEALRIVHEKLGLTDLDKGSIKARAEAAKVLIEGL